VDYLRLRRICTWTGTYKDIKQHLLTAHKDLCEDYNGALIIVLPSSKASTFRQKFFFAYNEIFCYRLIIQYGTMFVFLHYIGLAGNDSKYQYRVMVKNNEDTEGLIVTHQARSFNKTEDDLLNRKDCLKLHCDYIERFRNEQGYLTVSVEIFGVDD